MISALRELYTSCSSLGKPGEHAGEDRTRSMAERGQGCCGSP